MKKIRIMLSGCNGRMGQAVVNAVENQQGMQIVAGIDMVTVKKNDFPVYADPMEFSGEADVLVDFTNPSLTPILLSYCRRKGMPAVIATTGHEPEQIKEIEAAAGEIAIFRSANMSLGINLITELSRQAARLLAGAYDIEIIERHHNQKLDAPSGTALQIADALKKEITAYDAEYVFDRHAVRQKRGKNEIGMHAIRGGTIVGEHEIFFAGIDEVIEIKHSALSRGVFANGAVKAASFIAGRQSGMYNMNHLLSEILQND